MGIMVLPYVLNSPKKKCLKILVYYQIANYRKEPNYIKLLNVYVSNF